MKYILFKAVKDLNIGIATAVDILNKGGFEVENKPTTKLSEEEYQYLYSQLNIKLPDFRDLQLHDEESEITSFAVLQKYRKVMGAPASVFKYFPPNDYALASLEEKYLYHSKYTLFNDPFDCNINLIDFKKGNKLHGGARSEFENKLSHAGICCFTTSNSSILMWSHYAERDTGFCLEFKSNIRLRGVNPLNVVYKKQFIQANFHTHRMDAIYHLIYSKAACWEYENELRSLITDVTNENDRFIRFIESDLVAVYLGARCSHDTEMKIRSIMKARYKTNYKIYKAKLSSTAFEIVWVV